MSNFALYEHSAQHLLDDDFDGDAAIYENDMLISSGGTLSTVPCRISRSQAWTIMRSIVQDDVIAQALRERRQHAISNPNGNMPVDGAHPVDPAVALIEKRAIFPVLGPQVPVGVIMHFVRLAYDEIRTP